MNTNRIHSWKSILPGKGFWLLSAIVLAGRLLWWLYWGTLLESDSWYYLKMQTSLYHPPLYSVFNWMVLKIVNVADLVVFAQSLFFSLSVSTFLLRMIKVDRMRLILAFALALEPCSGKLACTLMSETLFLSLLFLAFIGLPALLNSSLKKGLFGAIWIGFLLGLAYLTRYVAPVFLVAVCIWMLVQRMHWSRVIVASVIMAISFQLVLVPLRLYYKYNFGTLQMNAFSSLSIWNATAYLYSGSNVQLNPETEFEHFLPGLTDTAFDIKATWYTSQIFGDSFAFQRFVRKENLGTSELLSAANSAGGTGIKLLIGAPIRHLREFVFANAARPFYIRNRIVSEPFPAGIDTSVLFQKWKAHEYEPALWWIFFLLLILSTVLQIGYRKRFSIVSEYLILACWLYLIGIAWLGVIFLRFVFVLGPIVLMALGIQMENLFIGMERRNP